ncbi:MAG TPA: hypothetical protein VLT83_04055, partial [Opitutaceae bacterium]|nr:hypothetical protein [Opitutaceae bacterium]
MPGIAGIIGRVQAAPSDDTIGAMVQPMVHEPSWKHGHCTVESPILTVGWVCPDGSSAAARPVWNGNRTVGLIFVGEEFSHGVNGDASAVLRLYEEHGAAFLAQLNGCYAGLLVDLPERKAVLFNDRFGLGRIYHHQSPDGFYFSSEAKSLLAALPRVRRLDPQGLAEFYAVGCVLQNRTLFDGVALLPPGSAWTFHGDGRVEKQRYFDPAEWEGQETLDAASYAGKLQEVFGRVAPRYLQGGRQVAMSLTGGLDSRAILAWVRAAPGSLPCYTFAGPYRDCADVRISRRLAQLTRQPHTTLRIGKEFFADFPTL